MSNGYFMPKNVFKGTDSSGNSYRFEEWDFATLATMEGFGFIFTLILSFALGSVAGPIILILLLLYSGTTARYFYIMPALISSYVLYDFAHGWLCLISASFFLSDKYLGYLMIANIITVLVSMVFIIFGGVLNKFVFEPVSHLTEDEFNKLKANKKKEFVDKIEKNKEYVVYLIMFLCVIGFLIGAYIQKQNKDWVKTNINTEQVDE